MRTIGIVTVGRSDYGIYRSVIAKILAEPEMDQRLYVTGMHTTTRFGSSLKEIIDDEISDYITVEMLLDSDSPASVVKSMGTGMISFGQVFQENRPDILLVLGDRFEMFAATVSAFPYRIPIAHIHGGEKTLGAMDESFRHAMTKMSHLHFVSTKEYASRVIQLGEEPWRVTVSGAPGLDSIKHESLLSIEQLSLKYGINYDPGLLLVTFHPTTMEQDAIAQQADQFFSALETLENPIVVTQPNSDPGNEIIQDKIRKFVKKRKSNYYFPNLGSQSYFSFMAAASAMLGNSSSGIIESPSFRLPVVNVGNRQQGRIRAQNVIDVGNSREEILSGLKKALSESFRKSLEDLRNPYGDGQAAERIVKVLATVDIQDERLLKKDFYDLIVTND